MTDLIIVAVIVILVGAASLYIYRAKKNGQKCIGCPSSKTCRGICCECGESCETKQK